ncbi:TonB-dependent receptor [Azoarcus sp. DD4]|uniref:TonB-dependent receptor n=1 Tax=Azoarcus sp. DD4 TaxID=2027405 RepID=UPI00112601B9|nr:TonB-dependent receptor [Azoarcus sp. DD4]QDF97016.1 TonB-dependent receptor [Azoarcus sp. DD4]
MKLNCKPLVLAVLGALSSGALAEQTSNKDGDTAIQLDEVVITGGAPSPLPPTVQAVVEGVTAETMAESINVVNTEDALKYLPSLQIRKRFIGDTNGIVASRSSGTLASARALVYADGLLLSNLLGNSFAYPPRWGLVTAEEIARIDVLYGPFSALYPGNSMGALIHMTTRMPDKLEAHVKAQAFTQDFRLYGTDESFSGHQLAAALGSRSGAWSWWFNASRLDSEGQPMGFVTRPASSTPAEAGDTVATGARHDRDPRGSKRVVLGATGMAHTVQDHAKLKLAYDFSPAVRATYTVGLWQNDADNGVASYLRDGAGRAVYSGTVNVDGRRYTLAATDFSPSRAEAEHWMHGLALKTSTGGEWDGEAVVSVYDYGKDLLRSPGAALPAAGRGGSGQIADLEGTGWTAVDLRGVWRAAGAHELSFGYHGDHYKLRTLVSNTSDWIDGGARSRKSAFTGDTETTALYLQEVWRFAPAWSATLGGRWERWEAHDGSISNATTTLRFGEREEHFFSPKLALAYRPAPEWMLRAALARAYRMPTVAELYQGSISANTIVRNDPGLKPEKALAAELTAERDLGNGLVRLSLFEEDAEDALFSQTDVTVTPNVTNIQNIDKIRTRGVELAYQGVDVGLRGLDLAASLTYADSEILANRRNPASVGKKQPRVPDWRAVLSATYRQSERLAYALGVRYSGRQYGELDNGDVNGDTYGGVGRFFVVDARVSYKLARQWTAALGVDNLNDQKHFVYHPYPQRTWVAELKADF